MNLELVKVKSISDVQNETNLQYDNHKLLQSSFKHPVSDSQNTKTTIRDKATALCFWQKKQENQSEGGQQLNSLLFSNQRRSRPTFSFY